MNPSSGAAPSPDENDESDENEENGEKDTDPANGSPPTQAVPLNSVALLGGRSELQIRHRGEIYTLRLTRNGKLILTK